MGTAGELAAELEREMLAHVHRGIASANCAVDKPDRAVAMVSALAITAGSLIGVMASYGEESGAPISALDGLRDALVKLVAKKVTDYANMVNDIGCTELRRMLGAR